MGEYYIRPATPADVDRLWPLFDERDDDRLFVSDALDIEIAELRRSDLVDVLLDGSRPLLVAYSGIRAVGYAFVNGDEVPYVSAGWRGLGADVELEHARSAARSVTDD